MLQSLGLILKLTISLLLLGLVLLIVLGSLGHILRQQMKPAFSMVNIEGERRLHTVCAGPEDAPFVLYDAGAFGIYADGWWILQALQADHHICLYDRAGMGWSDAVPDGVQPDPAWHVEEIRRLRQALGRSDPFILIGHSMAGLRLHAYANTYPDELLGLIFIDAVRPQTLNLQRASSFLPWMMRGLTLGQWMARIGVMGGLSCLLPDPLSLPAGQKQDKRRSMAAVRHHKATKAEIAAAFEAWPDAAWRLGEGAQQVPVFVYSRSPNGGSNADVAQAALADTGLGGVRALPDETHVSLLNQTNAQLVAQDVRAISQWQRDE